MKKQWIWKKCVPVFACVPLLLSGCSLLPQEETGGHLVLVQAVDSVQYELVEVTREDVQLIKDVYCLYQQSQDEKLAFGTGDRMVRYVHVKVGENVKKGDLLAELVSDDLVESIKEMRYDIEKNTLLLAQTEELKAFDLAALKTQYDRGGLTRAQYEEGVERIEEGYAGTIANYQDALYIKELRLGRLEQELEGCKIYAGIDGMVSMISSKMMEDLQTAGKEVIQIINKSQCLFCMDEMEYADYFTPGTEVTLINNNGTEYKTKVIPKDEAPDTDNVYLMVTEADATLVVGTRAYARLILDERKDALSLPRNVVHSAGGKSYVYCEDEDGLKSVRYITTGMVGSQSVEIIDGLKEGEFVIRK